MPPPPLHSGPPLHCFLLPLCSSSSPVTLISVLLPPPLPLRPTPLRLAKLAVDKIMTTPCETSILYPKHGENLHCFTAITPCTVLDILSPSYREDEGRKCTYYHDYPYSTFYFPGTSRNR
ncbi:hypothetical protein Ahy_A05g022750 [Arachis hypogaea]|uniref:cysteine dioxygenase n=1 Tax=Arachis hypogaea TaxID=3818 RepID=A0A445D1S5_ARAHY|nr:hypothetical protein Ahy_A05g022750 [Arachis hypogaea]